MSDKNPIDELFKNKFEEHKIAPSEAAWEKVAAATQGQKAAGFKPTYLMRAAVVLLLVGLSTWVYFENNQQVVMPTNVVTVPSNTQPVDEPATSTKEEPKETPEKENKKEEKAGKKEKPLPILKSSNSGGNKSIFVKHTPAQHIPEVDELGYENDFAMDNVSLSAQRVAELNQKPVKIELKYTNPVSKEWNEESLAESAKEAKLKNRVFAYANTQVNNLLNGKKMELPKLPKGKPQLEINLDKIFERN